MYNRIWCDYKELAKLPVVGKPQSLDCGWKVVILSRHHMLKKPFRSKKRSLKLLKADNMHKKYRGLFVTCTANGNAGISERYRMLFFDHLAHETRLLGLVVHEVSHLVDDILRNASVKVIDTEVRAYMNDYYCRHIFRMLKIKYNNK